MPDQTKRKIAATGIPRLDEIMGGVFIGDNVIWYDESGSLASAFWLSFIKSSLSEKEPVVFVSFDRSPKNLFERLGTLGRDENFTVLDCFVNGKGKGSDTFKKFLTDGPEHVRERVIQVDRPDDPDRFSETLYTHLAGLKGNVRLVFESLTGMQELWGEDDDISRFYQHSCPRLYDLNTVAYWIMEKGAHSPRVRAKINQIAQAVVMLSVRRGTSMLTVVKAEGREPMAVREPFRYVTRGRDIFFPDGKEGAPGGNLGSRIRELRIRHGLSQAELARRVGVTASTISQVESNTIFPSIPGLLKMAEILSVEPGAFFPKGAGERPEIVYHEENAVSVKLPNMPRTGGAARQLTPLDHEGPVEAFLIEIESGRELNGHFTGHKGPEMGFVVEGTVRFTLPDQTITANAGDLIHLASQNPLSWANPEKETARLLWVALNSKTPGA